MPTHFDEQIDQLKRALRDHPLYAQIQTPDALRIFMERHVVAVWDFMSLVKSLQQDLTCVQVPWIPPDDSEAARLINEIVLDEETDELDEGRYASHFELYLDAMQEAECDTQPINRLLLHLKQGQSLERSLHASGLPEEALCFTRVTLQLLQRPLNVRVAVFFHGREDLIPQMFVRMVEQLNSKGLRCNQLLNYLRRHIETDRERHGPLAERLLTRVCGDDPARREEAAAAAIEALQARLSLWDATSQRLEQLKT